MDITEFLGVWLHSQRVTRTLALTTELNSGLEEKQVGQEYGDVGAYGTSWKEWLLCKETLDDLNIAQANHSRLDTLRANKTCRGKLFGLKV